MAAFTDKEVTYINTQRLARLATGSPSGQPDVAAVVYRFDGEAFWVGGLAMESTLKFKNARRNPKVALVIDDLESVKPWLPRGIKLHGSAELIQADGPLGPGWYLKIVPQVKWSWGIEAPALTDGKATITKTKLG